MPRPRDPTLQQALAARLREIRTRAGWSQEALAAAIGVAPNNISHYETGKKALTIGTLAAISHAFGVTLAELVDLRAGIPSARAPATGAEELATIYEQLTPADQELVVGLARLAHARQRRR